MDVYIETSTILASLERTDLGERCDQFLKGLPLESSYLSELVLAEIHNLEEPRREWAARLLKERPFPILRVNVRALDLANKYFFNKVILPEHRDGGLHVAIASLRGCETLYTWDEDHLIAQQEGFGRINNVMGCPIPHLLSPFPIEEGWEDAELHAVRALSYRVTSRKQKKEVVRGVVESADFFMKEKGLNLQKVGKIEIF